MTTATRTTRGHQYNGQFWADGETAIHSRLKSCQNTIKKMQKQIRDWEAFAQRTPGEKAQQTAQRQIEACLWRIGVEEANAAHYREQIEMLEAAR